MTKAHSSGRIFVAEMIQPNTAVTNRDQQQDLEIEDLRRRVSKRETLNLISVVGSFVVAFIALAMSWRQNLQAEKAGKVMDERIAEALTIAHGHLEQITIANARLKEANERTLEVATDALDESHRNTEATRRLAIASGQSARALSMQLAAVEREQRPKLTAAGIDPVTVIPNKPVSVKVHYRNNGRIPAENVRACGSLYTATNPLDDIPCSPLPVSAASNIGPFESEHIWIESTPLEPIRVEAMSQGQVSLFFIAQVSWTDIYGGGTVYDCWQLVDAEWVFCAGDRNRLQLNKRQ